MISRIRRVAVGSVAVGALAAGTFAAGTLAVGTLTVGTLAAETVAFGAAAPAALAATPPAAVPARHLRLLRSAPADDTVAAVRPRDIRLWFSEAPELRTIRVELATADGLIVPIGEPTRDADEGAPVVAAISSPLAAGLYRVTWRSMSKDGHVVNGDFSFRVGPALSSAAP